MTSTREVAAVLGEEFLALMDALGVQEAFESGECKCAFCDKVIDSDNVLLLFPKDEGSIAFLCKSLTCVAQYETES